jgi:hypothetical protein
MNTNTIMKSALWLGTTTFILSGFGQEVITNQPPSLAADSTSSIVAPSNILPPPASAASPNFILVQQQIVQQPASGVITLQRTPVTSPVSISVGH